jgi:hypothetical protein
MKKVLMWLIIFAVLLMGGNISAFEPLFEARIDYSLDYGPQSVTSADFDGDGDYDLATVGGNNISIFLNNCNGTFAKPINYTAGYNLRSVTSADFDGDNDYDLAVASWEYTGHISILLNNGDGTFAEAINYTTGYRASSIISEDFDGDGDYDLAAASAGSYEYEGSLAILMNNGDGTFSEPIYYMAGEEVGSAISADFDGDGDYDLAAAVGFTFFILLNDGNGNFAESANFTVGFQPENLISADLDGDNDCDLVIGKYHHMSVLLNYGDGTFTDPIDYTGDFGNPSISTDTDGDGDFDVVATFGDGVSDRVSLLQNNGDGTFAEPIQYAASGVANKVLAADFDNNGFNDLAVICYFGEFLSSGGISVMINKGDGTFVAATPMGVIGTGVISADLDLDGDYDLAAAGNTTLSILQNNGNGIFADPLNYAMDSGFKSICAADFNGDSNIDLATVNNSCKFIFDYPNPGWVLSVVGSLDIMLNNGNGTFTSSYDSTWSVWGYDPYYWPNGSEDLSSIVSADFNGDIKNDLAMVMGWRNDVIICQNTGNGAFAGQFPIGIGVKQRSICSADFDGDDNNDLATGGGSISILLNDGAGAFTDPIYYLIGEDVRFVISVDFDGDGNYDLAAAKGFGVSILLNDGDGTFVTAYDYAAGYYPSSIFAYDFDNDGNIDLAVSNQGSNNVSILLGNGDGSFIEPYYSYGVLNSGTYGYGRQSVHGSDFDGDNDCDLIVGGNVSILFNQIDVRDRWAVIAIDRSGSMFHPDPLGQSRLERAKSMAHDEIDQLVDFSDPVYSGINQVAIMSFNSDGIVVEQDFTSNSSDLHNAIDQIANPRHDTPLAAAMCQAHCMLTDFNATAKYVFTFTDGLENGSEYFNICDICDPCSYLMETGWNYDCDISNPSSCTQWQLCLAEQFAPTGTNIVHYFGEPINPLDKGSTGLEDMYFLRSTAEEGDGAFFYHSDQVANGYLCGDANHDFSVNTSDAVTIINYIFAGGDPPDPFISGDTNCDEIVNVSDAVYIINFIFMGGHEPCFDCPQ